MKNEMKRECRFSCSLIKEITPKIRMLCFVLINCVLLNFFMFGSCFRTIAVILISEFLIFLKLDDYFVSLY